MALILPTPADLAELKAGLSEEDALTRAGDLFILATGIKDSPTNAFELRLISSAILEMAWHLQIVTDESVKESQYGPFQSETIGSYSYTKITSAVKSGDATGVSAFDAAVAYFLDQSLGTQVWSTSEFVFKPGYQDQNREKIIKHDASDTFYVDEIPFPDGPPVREVGYDEDGFPVLIQE